MNAKTLEAMFKLNPPANWTKFNLEICYIEDIVYQDKGNCIFKVWLKNRVFNKEKFSLFAIYRPLSNMVDFLHSDLNTVLLYAKKEGFTNG
jgi:hypothetical protein